MISQTRRMMHLGACHIPYRVFEPCQAPFPACTILSRASHAPRKSCSASEGPDRKSEVTQQKPLFFMFIVDGQGLAVTGRYKSERFKRENPVDTAKGDNASYSRPGLKHHL